MGQRGSLDTYRSGFQTVCCSRWTWKLRRAVFFSLPGEQHTYKCLSCPFSSMTISQLKEHSLRDHGETLTLQKLRAATQASHSTSRPLRLTGSAEQTSIAPDGNANNRNNHLPRGLRVLGAPASAAVACRLFLGSSCHLAAGAAAFLSAPTTAVSCAALGQVEH